MKNNFRKLLLAMAAVGLFGCSDKLAEEVTITGTQESYDDDGYIYMNAAVALPSSSSAARGTRSTTQTEGGSDAKEDVEYGYGYENDVRSMILVIASAENDAYITHAVVPGITQTPAQKPNSKFDFTVTQKFSRKDIAQAYDGNVLGTDKKVHLYAFCNYTGELLEKFTDLASKEAGTEQGKKNTAEWLDWTGGVEEKASLPGSQPSITNSIWSQRSFLMTNATKREATLPGKEDWDNYTNENNPFHLSGNNYEDPIVVERVAARIDYRDGSNSTVENNQIPYRYDLGTNVDGGTEAKNFISVALTRMALVNMSKNYHYLRRVSNDGTSSNWQITGTEKSNNYVVDTDWKEKQDGSISINESDDTKKPNHFFNFPLFAVDENSNSGYKYDMDAWYTDNIKEILDNVEDTWNDQRSPSVSGDYHIWRYVTENTLPAEGTNGDPQKAVQSTGIVFKALIIAGKDIDAEVTNSESDQSSPKERYISEKVKNALEASAAHKPMKGSAEDENNNESYDYPTLYMFNNFLYAGIDELVKDAVKGGTSSPLYEAMATVLRNWYTADADGTKFEYYAQNDKPTNGVQLTVAICDAILNGTKHTDVDDKYTETTEPGGSKYTIDFTEKEGTVAALKKLITDKKITIYEASNESKELGGQGWGYYCYYFYWNRHNDNGKSGVMGPMEFATVRNNVYKLSVSKISLLGHPRIPDNDPDPVDPDDPDEELKVYMDVKVEVLPWVVRVNDIEF